MSPDDDYVPQPVKVNPPSQDAWWIADPIRPPETDDEPWVVSTEHLPWEWRDRRWDISPERLALIQRLAAEWEARQRRRFSLRVLILCGAIGAAIAFAAWWTTR